MWSGFWRSLKERWTSTSRQLRILLLGGVAIVLVAAIVIVLILNHTEYMVLYNNLTPAENAEVFAQLQEIGVQPRMEGTALLIPASQENAVRMHLAVRAHRLGPGQGFEIYQMSGGLTATQEDRRFFATAQAEANLAAMIRTFPEVRDVQVTIRQQDNAPFIFESDRLPASVAVRLEMMPGRRLRPEQIQGIVNLILTSVQGVSEDNISIVDDTGDLRLMLGDSTGDRHIQMLHLTEQINEVFRRRILRMLHLVYGEGRVEVSVNSVLDTTERTVTRIEYLPIDPDDPRNNPVDFWEQEFERSVLGRPAEGVPGATDNIDVPMYLRELDDTDAFHVYSRSLIDFLVGSEHTTFIDDGLDIVDMTVAVVIDADTLPVGERDIILDLVAGASGVQPDRISVQNLAFHRDEAPAETPLTMLALFFRNPFLLAAAILAILIIIGLTVWLIIAARRRKREAMMAPDLMEAEDPATLMELMAMQDEDFEPIQLPETQEQKLRNQIKNLADSDPEIVAQLIKTWLLSA